MHNLLQLFAKVMQHLGTMSYKRNVGDEYKNEPWVAIFVNSLMQVVCASRAVNSNLDEMVDKFPESLESDQVFDFLESVKVVIKLLREIGADEAADSANVAFFVCFQKTSVINSSCIFF